MILAERDDRKVVLFCACKGRLDRGRGESVKLWESKRASIFGSERRKDSTPPSSPQT